MGGGGCQKSPNFHMVYEWPLVLHIQRGILSLFYWVGPNFYDLSRIGKLLSSLTVWKKREPHLEDRRRVWLLGWDVVDHTTTI